MSDSKLALDLTQGIAVSEAYPGLNACAFGIGTAVRAQRCMQYEHVPSHIGHPWNELVDSLAHSFGKGSLTGNVQDRLAILLNHSFVDWLWLTWTADTGAYPPIDTKGNFVVESCPTQFQCLLPVDISPAQMFEIGIKAIGGMERFVKKGQTVLVKPNIGWNRTPLEGANTQPDLVGQIVKMALAAGAKEVNVFDNNSIIFRRSPRYLENTSKSHIIFVFFYWDQYL